MMTDPEFLHDAYGTADALKIRIRAQELYGTGAGFIFDEMTTWALSQVPCQSVLDIGMGTGNWYKSLRALCNPSVRYIGLDASATMVATMTEATGDDPLASLHQGDAERLLFSDNHFDWVGLHYMLYHVPHPQVALAEAWRVTKPGGLVLTLAHGLDALQSLMALQKEAVSHCLSRRMNLTTHTYNLEHGSKEFPDPPTVGLERRPSGLRFPDVGSALAYYGSGFWQRGLTREELQDPRVKSCLFDFMHDALEAIITRVGYFDVPGSSGWLWAKKPRTV